MDPGEPAPHPAITMIGNKSKRAWTHLQILISFSFFANPAD
jgi:hypothetical protein